MLTIQHLYKSYKGVSAVNDLQLHIDKGTSFGFVGPNGAGKTTTLRIVAGLLLPESGKVMVDGINALAYPEKLSMKIGYMPDFFGVYDNLKAIEYMEFYASMYGLAGKEVKKKCYSLMEMMNLKGKENAYVDTLSRGMKQRLCLARCLIHDPKLLILDEPASGLDPRARYEMKEIIIKLAQAGKTIIISSHILPELMQMCNQIGIMEQGRIVLQGSVEEINKIAKERSSICIHVLEQVEKAVDILKCDPNVKDISIRQNDVIIHYNGEEMQEVELLKNLLTQGVKVNGFAKEKGDLETLFMRLTDNTKEETV